MPRDRKPGTYKVKFVCFPSLKYHNTVLAVSQFMQTVVWYFLVLYFRRTSLVLVGSYSPYFYWSVFIPKLWSFIVLYIFIINQISDL